MNQEFPMITHNKFSILIYKISNIKLNILNEQTYICHYIHFQVGMLQIEGGGYIT